MRNPWNEFTIPNSELFNEKTMQHPIIRSKLFIGVFRKIKKIYRL